MPKLIAPAVEIHLWSMKIGLNTWVNRGGAVIAAGNLLTTKFLNNYLPPRRILWISHEGTRILVLEQWNNL